MPFLTVIDTPTIVEQIKGLLNIYKVDGWLPDCHMSLCKGYTQGGSNADNVISDAFQKIGGTEIDWDLTYEAVVKDAEEEPYGEFARFLLLCTTAYTSQIGVAKGVVAWILGKDSDTYPSRISTTKALVR